MRSESELSSDAMVYGSKKGLRFYRNNNGAMQDKTGRLVRYGLRYPGGGSDKLNKNEKSPDYIIAVPIQVTPEMVGHTLCVMGGIEMKPEGYNLTSKLKNPNTREYAQNKWMERLLSYGGIAGFVTTVSDIDNILTNFFNRFKP